MRIANIVIDAQLKLVVLGIAAQPTKANILMSDRLWSGSDIKIAELKNYGFGFVLIYFGRTKKIGNIFKQLGTLLNQHQTRLKKLNNIKQACLEKMFV